MENRIPPPLLALVAVAGAWGMDRALPHWSAQFPGQAIAALILVAAGLLCILGGLLAFRAAGTTVDPLHPERASRLVIAGIYRHTRNPMYLGLALLLVAWSAWLGQVLSLLLVAGWIAWINRFQILPEEAALRRRFGAAYVAYCNSVPRCIR